MKQELQEQLFEDYPSLYRDRENTLMKYGISCGDGWYPLLDEASRLLSSHDTEMKAEQVKEKFGQLRFYLSGGGEYGRGVVMAAGFISGLVCDVCGKAGVLFNRGGYVSTKCKEHGNSVSGEPLDLPLAIVGKLLESCRWNTEHNGMPEAILDISHEDRLVIELNGGDEMAHGMVDMVITYVNRHG